MRYSLREFLVIAGVASVGVASAVAASGVISSMWIVLMHVFATCLVINCVMAKGSSWAFSVGFLSAAVLYGAGISYYDKPFNFMAESPLTTKALHYPWFAISKQRNYWINEQGDRVLQPSSGMSKEAYGSDWYVSGSGTRLRSVNGTDYASFMTIAHCLWALLFGYFGGKYAVWVYSRRAEA